MTGGSGTAVEALELMRHFAGRHGASVVRAVDGVSFKVPAGGCVALRGPSGCGKSTLLGLLSAIDRPTAGVMLHDGTDLRTLSAPALALQRRVIGLAFQGAPMLRGLPVWENVTQALVPQGVPARSRRELATARLEEVCLGHLAERRPRELSGGELQRVALCRATICRPALLVADEPTSQLDEDSAGGVIAILQGARDRGTTLVIASHDPAVLGLADRVLSMRAGRLTG